MGTHSFGRCAALVVLGAFAACGGESPRGGDTASARAVAALVPADTVVYARFASLDALVASARSATSAFGGDASEVGRDELLAGLGPMAGDTSQIDGGRTIGIALVAPKGVRPMPVVFVPVKDGAKYAASLRAAGLEAVVDGGYAALAIGGKYTKPASPSALATAMPAGLVAVRVDVATAAENLGVLINSGLDVAEREIGKQMSQGMKAQGVDGEAMVELYMDLVKSLLASGTTLDLVLDEADGRATVVATYVAKAGSAFDGWSSPPVDLSSFAGKLSGKAPFDLVTVTDWAKVWPKLEPLSAAFFDIYPAAIRQSMQDVMKGYPQLYERLGPVLLAEVEVEDGLRAEVHVAPPDAKALLAELDAFATRGELAGLGLTLTPQPAKDGGTLATREWQATFDEARMLAVAGDDATAKSMAERMAAVYRHVFGDGLQVRLAATDGRGVLRVGKRADDPAPALAAATGAWPVSLRPALAVVDGCNPVFVQRMDLAAMMRLAASMSPPPAAMRLPPASTKVDLVVGAGVRGAEWRGVLAMDLAGLGAMFQQMMPK